MNTIDAESFTSFLALATLLVHIGIIFFFFGYFFFRRKIRGITEHFSRNAITYALLVALGATLGSLFYSDVQGLEPCTLCWYQRIFMYPLVFIFIAALFRKDGRVIVPYAAFLNFIGLLLAGYHTYLQSGLAATEGATTCSIYSEVSCTDSYFIEYGYITIPVFSLTAFGLIAILLWLKKKHG
jgi:disulfide bond formation protein DsbB